MGFFFSVNFANFVILYLGALAERLGRGLQNLLGWFDSDRHLFFI